MSTTRTAGSEESGLLGLLVGRVLCQGQQDHGQFLPVDLSVLVVVDALKNGLFKLLQVGSVVILFN